VVYIAETLSLGKLNAFIKKARGSSTINVYLVVLYKKYVPVSAFILTIMPLPFRL
jgi:lipopolysaccharide export system permease protein